MSTHSVRPSKLVKKVKAQLSFDDIDTVDSRTIHTVSPRFRRKLFDFGTTTDSDVDQLPEHREENQTYTSSGMLKTAVESEVSVADKLNRLKYLTFEDFAEIFIDEIIDVSIEVCEKLHDAARGSVDNIIQRIPCVCDATDGKKQASIQTSLDSCKLVVVVDKNKFSGWPTIKHFSIDIAKQKIKEFMTQWHYEEDWKCSVNYISSYSDKVSDFHLFQGMWSIPTKEYPIAQATATIFFTVEVSRVKPKFCLVNVTLQFEGSSSVYKAGQFEFIEQWLFNIIDSKLKLFKTLKF